MDFFESRFGVSLVDFWKLPRDRAAALARDKHPDLLRSLRWSGERRAVDAPARERAENLERHIAQGLRLDDAERERLRDRIVTDRFLRSELDRDQNVYLGRFFTRVLTNAVPDVVFQPQSTHELELALAWARSHRVGVSTRGAGSTAMGGAVPNNGGVLLEMSRFDQVQVDATDRVAVVGAGARMKNVHAALAQHGVALKTYPSNLGGTLAGWFCTGGLGLNSFKYGPVCNQVRALSVVLPRGEHVRLHDDGRLDVLFPGSKQPRLSPEEAVAWLGERGYASLRLQDFAGTEGQFGVVVTFTVDVITLPRFHPFYFEFGNEVDALGFVQWLGETAAARECLPANLKYLSQAHVEAVHVVRGDAPHAAGPAVYVDFDTSAEAERFEAGLDAGKWKVSQDASEAGRWLNDRFRPQQAKRLGPGLVAAEILMPARHVQRFLQRATRLAQRVGVHLETEVYFFSDGRALALPGYLTQGPRRGFLFELALAPVLVDLAMSRYDGEPYVLGRWQSPFFGARYRAGAARELRRSKERCDPERIVNPGVFFAPAFRVWGTSSLYRTTFPAGVRLLRWLYGWAPSAWFFRKLIANAPLHAQAPAVIASLRDGDDEAQALAQQLEALRPQAQGCVNCGECNSVCPIFHDAKIRLPQMLTHIGETLNGPLTDTPEMLLDLCMRCGNCEEVCQADIPHLALYAAMENKASRYEGERVERHAAILTHLRQSEGYMREFLGVRPGGYVQRTPASLPGAVRHLVFRAENDSGPVETCIHCGACVHVCPTQANHEYEFTADLRRITTDMSRCVGCGTCVEVCPANLKNGGRTLRVMEAPALEFFRVAEALEVGREGA